MKPLTKAEKFIKKAFLSNDGILKLTCDLFIWHFKNIDNVEGTQHLLTINYLYRLKNRRLTKQAIANETYSNVKALKAEREKYVKYFFYFYSMANNGKVTAESAIAGIK